MVHESVLSKAVWFVCSIVVIGFLDFVVASGLLKTLTSMFLGPKFKALKFINGWISNIPGNPTCLDHLVTVLLGPYPEMNDFNAILTGVPLDGPVLLHGVAPKCRYYSFQLFIPMMKVNSPKQCIRDVDVELAKDGTFTILLSRVSERPKWCRNNWIEIPEDATKCILMYRCYCPEVGVGLRAPSVWFQCTEVISKETSISTFDQAVVAAGEPEKLDDENRVMGMFPAQFGIGSSYHRLKSTIIMNMVILLIFGNIECDWLRTAAFFGNIECDWLRTAAFASSLAECLFRYNPIPSIHVVLPLSTLYGYMLYRLAFKMIARKHRNNILIKQKDSFVPNRSVVLPESILGHPNHMYYTVHYDCSNVDVKIKGIRKSKGFTYTSVTCYGWSSLPLTNGQFRYDETLIADQENVPKSSIEQKGEEPDETYTLYLTSRPTFEKGINEIDVSQETSGLCFIRIIYPESDDVVKRCTPVVEPVPRRNCLTR